MCWVCLTDSAAFAGLEDGVAAVPISGERGGVDEAAVLPAGGAGRGGGQGNFRMIADDFQPNPGPADDAQGGADGFGDHQSPHGIHRTGL